ncbi:hypothetical protein S7711_10544 [Stachybotrys chartarum IBT 7711]|uniref:Uncharacterized protein n=1 Tax=Stachybotrys chartarum (strain CBS 109288 / IBT 7711) TaxID=1280523 RepID=A0A084AW54_STACB|nr:hypothetical protein S7711_10544 [Stachybotrys chartarum IBT 7711]KFA53310.1 hypothetical protein S40293_10838 [Stachybotrys chartarum IBT 40293]KFA79039.1 hypothetical protein S40288_10490 [Stachybotrys chartarum IBT 40288]
MHTKEPEVQEYRLERRAAQQACRVASYKDRYEDPAWCHSHNHALASENEVGELTGIGDPCHPVLLCSAHQSALQSQRQARERTEASEVPLSTLRALAPVDQL